MGRIVEVGARFRAPLALYYPRASQISDGVANMDCLPDDPLGIKKPEIPLRARLDTLVARTGNREIK